MGSRPGERSELPPLSLAGLWGRIEQRLREWAAQGELLHRIEVGSAALLEIAEPQHAGAQLRKPACLRQSETTDLLGGLFFAPSSDLLPIMPTVPSPVGPMLHLVNPFGLHGIPPNSVRWRGSTDRFWRQSGLSVGLSWQYLLHGLRCVCPESTARRRVGKLKGKKRREPLGTENTLSRAA